MNQLKSPCQASEFESSSNPTSFSIAVKSVFGSSKCDVLPYRVRRRIARECMSSYDLKLILIFSELPTQHNRRFLQPMSSRILWECYYGNKLRLSEMPM